MKYTVFLSRVLMATIFIVAGLDKVQNFTATQDYMQMMGVAGWLIIPTIVFELAAGAALVFGYQTKWSAGLLAAFCILTAVIFHANFSDQMQAILFMKNLSMAGGLVLLSVHGAGSLAVDHGLINKPQVTG